MSALWNVPEREKWFGGGYDDAGIHTISPDPRDSDRVFVAISCGGVWETQDAGKSWKLHGKGMVATYMPPEQAGQLREPGPASRRALCGRARRDVDAAPLRHLPLDRRRRTWTQLKPPATISALRSPRIRSDPTPHGSCPRSRMNARAARRRAGRYAHPRWRQDLGELWARACRSATPIDLIYRHCLDVDDTGTQLAMGSTTGALGQR